MKQFQRFLSLLLVFAVLFAFAACDGKSGGEPILEEKDPAKQLYGQWIIEIDLNDFMNEMLGGTFGDDFPKCYSELPFAMIFEFNETGEHAIRLSMKQQDFDAYIDDFCDCLINYLVDLYEKQGISREQLDAQMKATYGMNLEEYAKDVMDTSTKDAVSEFNKTAEKGYFVLKENTVYMVEDKADLEGNLTDADYMIISIDADTMTVSEIGGEFSEEFVDGLSQMGIDLPWKFKKQ